MNLSVVHCRVEVCGKLTLHTQGSAAVTWEAAHSLQILPPLRCCIAFSQSVKSDYVCVPLVDALQKNQRELAKMKKCLRPEELVSHMGQMDTQAQQEELEKSYQITLEDYRRILERLASQAWSDSRRCCRWPALYIRSPDISTDLSCNQEEPPHLLKKSLLIDSFERISRSCDFAIRCRWGSPVCFQFPPLPPPQCTSVFSSRGKSLFYSFCVFGHIAWD